MHDDARGDRGHVVGGTLPVNPALTGLREYFTDSAARARADNPDAPWIDLSIGDPAEPAPAFVREALTAAVTRDLRYPTVKGSSELRSSVAGWFARRHGVTIDPESQVLPSAGSKEAIFHLPLALIDPGGRRDIVVWGTPGYPIYERSAVLAGGTSLPVTLTAEQGWRLELDGAGGLPLDRAALAWLNYPHNPTGATVDVPYLRRQLDVARAHGFVLASDECYQELWSSSPAPSLLEACDDDLSGVLVFVSLSKRSGMTGYRSGAIVGDAELIDLLRRLRVNIGTASPTFVQAAATAAWADDSHVAERRRVFADKRAVLHAALTSVNLEVPDGQAGLCLWARVPDGDDAAYARALLDAHIVVTPGRAFGDAGRGWIRLALVPDLAGCGVVAQRWRELAEAGQLPLGGRRTGA